MPQDAERVVDELEERVADEPAPEGAPADPDVPDHNAKVPGAEEPPD